MSTIAVTNLKHESASGNNITLASDGTAAFAEIISAAKGIKFPGTAVASADPNTLDDYEEGTWTPTLTGSVSGSASNGFSGIYTKIGNVVYARIQALNPNAATITGSWRFALPFTAKSNEYMGGYVAYQRSVPTVSGGTYLSGYVYSGTSLIGLIYNKNTTAESEGVSGNVPANSMLLGITVVYVAA